VTWLTFVHKYIKYRNVKWLRANGTLNDNERRMTDVQGLAFIRVIKSSKNLCCVLKEKAFSCFLNIYIYIRTHLTSIFLKKGIRLTLYLQVTTLSFVNSTVRTYDTQSVKARTWVFNIFRLKWSSGHVHGDNRKVNVYDKPVSTVNVFRKQWLVVVSNISYVVRLYSYYDRLLLYDIIML